MATPLRTATGILMIPASTACNCITNAVINSGSSNHGRWCWRTRVGPPRIEWDPDGVLGPPRGGHIARRQMQKQMDQMAEIRRQRQRRRQARIVPDTDEALVNYLLETEALDMEYEIARCRPRLNHEFLGHLRKEIAALRFAIQRTKETDDRLVELEALNKVLVEGIEAYDKMTKDLTQAKDRLAKVLASKDIKKTLLDMVEKNELDRALLSLLDENIVMAQAANQEQAVGFMNKIRTAMLKYMTL